MLNRQSSPACQAHEPCGRTLPLLPHHLSEAEPMLRVLVSRWQEQLWHGDLEHLEIASQQLIANAEIRGNPEAMLFSRILMGEVWRAQGRLDSAEQILMRQRDILLEHRRDLTELYQLALFFLGKIAHEEQNTTMLKAIVQQLWDQKPPTCVCYHWVRRNFLAALLELEQGHYSAASQRFIALSEGPGGTYDRLTARLGVVEAMALQGEGNSMLAHEMISQIALHVDQGNYEGVFRNHEGLFPHALAVAENRHFTTRTQTAKIVHLHTSPLAHPDPDIIIETFGPGRLFIHRQEVPLEMPLERIVVAILGLYPLGVDIATLHRDIWPESASHDAIHRHLKKMADKLGHDVLVYEQGVYRLEGIVRCDALEHDDLYNRAFNLEWGSERFPALRAASTLYHAPFLNGITRHLWAEERRTYYERHQGLVFYQMAGIHYLDHDPQQAADLLDKALIANPIFDPAVRDLLKLLEYLGEHNQALKIYRIYDAKTRRLFDCPPSRELQELAMRIRQSVPVSGAFSENSLERAGVRKRRTLPNIQAADAETIAILEHFFHTSRPLD